MTTVHEESPDRSKKTHFNVFADFAPKFFECGLPIIPTYGKIPTVKNWEKYCLELPDGKTFEEWLREFPSCNIGLCLGPASGYMAFDWDYGSIDHENFVLSKILPSPIVKRGHKGWTAFYRYNPTIQSRSFKFKNGVAYDILSLNRQTVIPPSLHPDTRKPYEWIQWPGGKSV